MPRLRGKAVRDAIRTAPSVRLACTGFLSFAILLTTIAPLAAAGDEYRLGPQDRVRLKVFEWRPSSGEVIQFTALNDEFAVGADGTLSLPFVGAIEVQAMQPAGLGATIAERLAARMGLQARLEVAVEVTRYRPFYILGDVTTPGEYEYRPGLSVVQAVSSRLPGRPADHARFRSPARPEPL